MPARRARARARMGREDDRLARAGEPPRRSGARRSGSDVRLAVNGQRRRSRRLEPSARDASAPARSARRAASRRPSRRRRPRAGPARPRARAAPRERSSGQSSSAESRSTAIRFRSSGIVEVEAPQPRLDVRDRGSSPAACAPASVEFVSPKTSTQSGRSASIASRIAGRHRARVGGAQVEPVARLGEAELVEEDLRELAVVVLPRVQHDLVDPRLPERSESGADLMNCGRFPTTERTRTAATIRGASRAVSSVGRAGDS